MKARCRNANGKNPAYTDVDLKMTEEEWIVWSVPLYEKFDLEFPGESPSAARAGDRGHYEIGNIRIIPMRKNREEQFDPILKPHRCHARPDGKKICSRCLSVKTVDEFTKRSSSIDGLTYWCRVCQKEYHRQWVKLGKLP